MMVLIREVVEEALQTGYLTVEAENRLRDLLSSKYDLEDLNAFMLLQHAAMSGRVKQQSRELFRNRKQIEDMSSSPQQYD